MMKAVEEVKAHWIHNGADYIQVSMMAMWVMTTFHANLHSPIETSISGRQSLGQFENSHSKV